MKSSLFKISSRYGALAGVLVPVFFMLLFYLGRNPFLVAPFLDFRIFLFGIFIFFAMKEFRDYHQGGLFYFWQGLFSGFIVVVFSSLIGALGLWVFGRLEPRFLTSYIEGRMAYYKTFAPEDIERVGKEAFERNLLETPNTDITGLVMTHFVQGMVLGFFVTLVLSVVVRRTDQTL
jgi:hypothetical protein